MDFTMAPSGSVFHPFLDMLKKILKPKCKSDLLIENQREECLIVLLLGGKDEKQKKNFLTIVLDNRMYLTHMFLGLIIANCDFRNAANQRKLGGHPRRGTKLEELQLLESLHNGKARKIVAHSRAGLESKVLPRFSLWMSRENWTTHHDVSQNQGQLYSDSLCRIRPRIKSRHTQEMRK